MWRHRDLTCRILNSYNPTLAVSLVHLFPRGFARDMEHSEELCASCKQPLVVEIELDEEDDDVEMGGEPATKHETQTQTVPDDCKLPCGDHFHWQCLLDAYEVHECPHCSAELLTTNAAGIQQLLCTLNNEGGLQPDLDILPLLSEEAYLKTYPEERRCRAFLEFCREGDLQAIIEMLQDSGEDDGAEEQVVEDENGQKREVDMLRYQDPLGEMQSGLHAAISAGSREVAWLLLLLASRLDLQSFPPEVFQEAGALGVMRDDSEVAEKVDIRVLKDTDGQTAADLAKSNVIFTGWEKYLTP